MKDDSCPNADLIVGANLPPEQDQPPEEHDTSWIPHAAVGFVLSCLCVLAYWLFAPAKSGGVATSNDIAATKSDPSETIGLIFMLAYCGGGLAFSVVYWFRDLMTNTPPEPEGDRTGGAPEEPPKQYVNWDNATAITAFILCFTVPFFIPVAILRALYEAVFVPPGENPRPTQPERGRDILDWEDAQARADEIPPTGKAPSK